MKPIQYINASIKSEQQSDILFSMGKCSFFHLVSEFMIFLKWDTSFQILDGNNYIKKHAFVFKKYK